MFIKQLQSKIQTRSVSNVSGHSNLRYSAMATPQCNTVNVIWDINQIGLELGCHDDPILNDALQLINNHQVNRAIFILNQLVSDNKKYLGQQSQLQLIMKVTLLVVSSAMSILEDDPASALLLLLGCDQMFKGLTIQQQAYLRVQILNGLGCYYRRVGQLEKALEELECALAMIKKYSLKEVAVTHLNLSVVLSLVDDHEGALENAKKAVTESHKEYQYYIRNHVSLQTFKFQRCVSSLAISFYNVGVQEQYFQKYQFALQAYASASKVAEDNLGIHNYLTLQLKNIYEQFARQLTMAEGQKIAITSLNHKFQIRANIKSQYAQSALKNQPQEAVRKVTDRISQSGTKRLDQSLRPQSAMMSHSQHTKLKSFDFTKREGYTTHKQISTTNRTLNQFSEDNTKTEIEKLEKSKLLQHCIQNLESQAQKEQEKLKTIQEEKQKELQKLQAFRYINEQIRQKKQSKYQNQTVRDLKQSIDQTKQIYNTDPQIQEILDQSDPQPLVAHQSQIKSSKTEIEENQMKNQIFTNAKNLKQEEQNKRLSIEIKLEQKVVQEETIHSLNRKLEFEQDFSLRNNDLQQNTSYKQIEDLEEINEVNQEYENKQSVENQIQEIIQQNVVLFNEEQQQQSINKIQQFWKLSQKKLNERIQKLESKYQLVTKKQYFRVMDENNNLHNGIIFLGYNQKHNIDILFIDFYVIRKSQRICQNIKKKLEHILILTVSTTFNITKDILEDFEKQLLPFIQINNQSLIIQSLLLKIEIKSMKKSVLMKFDVNQLNLYEQYPKLEESIQNYQVPTTIADIQSFNIDSIVIQKSASLNLESIQQPFQEISLVSEKILQDAKPEKQEKNQNEEQEQPSVDLEIHSNQDQQQSKNGSDDVEKANQTGQFNINFQSSQYLQYLQSQNDQDNVEEENENQKQRQNQLKESTQNLDFTLQDNESNNSIIGQVNNVDTGNQQLDKTNKNKEKPLVNQTIVEEEEENQYNYNSIEEGKQLKEYYVESQSFYSNSDDNKKDQSKQNQEEQTKQNSQVFPDEKSQINILQVPFQQYQGFSKQTSLQLPDSMKENIDSDKEISSIKKQRYENLGIITGINKINGTPILIHILINKEQQLFQAKTDVEKINVKPTFFKVENIEKTIRKPQKYLKGFLVNWKNQTILKIYTKVHQNAVLKLQRQFKFDHYRRDMKFKLTKTDIEGTLHVGFKKQIIYLAIETKSTYQRNSYTFRKENYGQFVKNISFRIINNLRFSEQKGIYLEQESQLKILVQNQQVKIFKLVKSQNAYEFTGFGLLIGTYDSVHQKIIIASDNQKVKASLVDIPKSINGDQLTQFTLNLLNRSNIIERNNECFVIYYMEKDEDSVKKIQNAIFKYQTIKTLKVCYNKFEKGQIIKREMVLELQRKVKRYYGIKCQQKFYQIGKLKDQEFKNLIFNFQTILGTFLIQKNNEIEIDVNSIIEFLNQDGQFFNLQNTELKDFILQQ
ncbi:unnamed protein product (macronuclear) [Paramecium tetraurelia]|uniref:Tetratricopeptide repeat protein n=1 Tax=Paramecium tetraurelia TaxID=5888 RepID=A0CH00_PARTE|nr:uncharacterized protein GSPATT00007507001 [Paramecium tetraurelia]CAK70067.1 unnamed protein product [Paramecium tetraurelia]|eukprot:XP_001437464.1 hypothetical protein (macronuclear) [Paramecium tetraurelia strain d4-2]